MASKSETEGHVSILPRRGGRLDIYRVSDDFSETRQETHEIDSVNESLDYRLKSENESLRESEIFLGLNLATAAILFVEALRQRSKTVAIAAIIPVAGVLYANNRRINHMEEIKWIEKESIAVENHFDEN
jgi:hypothetical protein